VPNARSRTVGSSPGPGGLVTLLNEQRLGPTRYFDAAGFVGRTVGLTSPTAQSAQAQR
jgi:hypothetical protein